MPALKIQARFCVGNTEEWENSLIMGGAQFFEPGNFNEKTA